MRRSPAQIPTSRRPRISVAEIRTPDPVLRPDLLFRRPVRAMVADPALMYPAPMSLAPTDRAPLSLAPMARALARRVSAPLAPAVPHHVPVALAVRHLLAVAPVVRRRWAPAGSQAALGPLVMRVPRVYVAPAPGPVLVRPAPDPDPMDPDPTHPDLMYPGPADRYPADRTHLRGVLGPVDR